jgi:hypothetical protein
MKILSHHILYISIVLYSAVFMKATEAQERFPDPGPLFSKASVAMENISIKKDSLDMIIDLANAYGGRKYGYLFRKSGVLYSLANHVLLFIDERYKVLYMHVGHVDDNYADLA